jgi:hypothetical protein
MMGQKQRCPDKCRTVKYYQDIKSWHCMLCFHEFEPTQPTSVKMKKGVWTFQAFDEEEEK